MSLEWEHVIVHTAHPIELGTWWADAMSWAVVRQSRDRSIRPAPDRRSGLVVVTNHDPKVAKSRLHPDFHPDDKSAEVDRRVRLVRLGARRTIISQGNLPWGLLTDPDGDSRLFLHARSIVRAKNEPATGES